MTNQEKTGRSEAGLDQQYSDEPFLVVRFITGQTWSTESDWKKPAVGQFVSTGNVFNVKPDDFCTSLQMCRGTRMSVLAIFTLKTIDDNVSPVCWLLSLGP